MATGTGGPAPADANNLALAYGQVCTLIAQITASPKPSYSVGGVSYSWESYMTMLVTQQKELLKALQMANGPFEIGQRYRS